MKAILGIIIISLLGSAALAYGLSTEFLFKFDVNGGVGFPYATTSNSTHILVTDGGTKNVYIFDSLGVPAGSFPTANLPRGITMNSTHILVTGGDDVVQVFNLSGNSLATFGGPADLGFPEGIAMNSTHILVADTGQDAIVVFNLSGVVQDTIATGGILLDPRDVAFDTSGRIIVADTGNGEMKILTPSGNIIDTFGDGTLITPFGVEVDSQNRIIVSDMGDDQIEIFDSAGNFLTRFGSTGTADGQFNDPQMLTVDSNDRIIVPDFTNKDVQVFAYATESSTGGGGGNTHKTAPTSGLDWTTHRQIVTDGFRVNDFIVTIDDNW